MFIALNYIMQFIEYRFIQTEIYNTLDLAFHQEIQNKSIELSPDATVKFNLNSQDQELFGLDCLISNNFKEVLDNFIPGYLNIITDERYINKISEVRIEGHTDVQPPKDKSIESYIYNLELSSCRARAVLNHIRNSETFLSYSDNIRDRLDFLFTANGLSYSRALNDHKEIAYLSVDKDVNNSFSRRVEFKIVTSNDELIDQMVK